MKGWLHPGFILILLLTGNGCSTPAPVPTLPPVIPNNFLSSSTYTSLVIEIVSVVGYEPSATSVNNLKTFLSSRLNKSAGITVVQSSIASSGYPTYSVNDVKTIEASNRKQKTSGTTLTAFVLFVDGDYAANSGNSKVLGFAYENSSITIFEKTIRSFSGGVGQATVVTVETTVLEHEFGHLLGLVNNGSALQTQHQDSANGKHCNNQNCLMYFNVETSDVVANLLGGTVPALDANCLADLQGNGGK